MKIHSVVSGLTAMQPPAGRSLRHGQCQSIFAKASFALCALFFCCFMIFGAAAAKAQSANGSLTGQVVDATGAALPGAEIVVTNVDTGLTAKGEANNTGVYLVSALPPGHYTLTTTSPGFETTILKGITLTIGQSGTLNVTMKVGGAAGETVSVTADAELVNTTTAEIGSVVNEASVTELPLNGRDPSSLVLLTTGVSNVLSASGNAGWKNSVSMPTETGASAGGGRQGSTYYLLDGAPNMDTYMLLAAPFPNADATQEFRAVTNNFDARYGFSPGAVVTVETKGGTNAYHGGAFWFVRNNDLNASDYFSHAVDLLKRNQFGGFIGGPIKKDKLFFFANYQATKGSVQGTGNSVFALDKAMLNGDFSEISTKLSTTAGFDANNQIDPSKFNSAAVKLVNDAYPIGDSYTTATMYKSASHHYMYNEGTGRLDYTINDKQRALLRSFTQMSNQPAATINGNALSTVAGNLGKYMNETIGHTWTVNNNMVNTFNVFWNEMNVATMAKAHDNSGNEVCLSNYINITQENGFCDFLGVAVTGSYQPFWGMTYSDLRNTMGFSEVLSYLHGNHNFTAGTTMQHQRMEDYADFPIAPYVGFWGQYSGNSLADFLLGKANMFWQGGGEVAHVAGMQYGFFVQDQYKFRPNLTFTVGVRWDPNTPPQVPFGRGATYRAGEQSTVFPNAPKGLLFVGDKGVGAGLVNTTYNYFQPRIGVAYQPKALPKTSFRAGFGMFTGPLPYSYYSHVSVMAPWSPTYEFFATDIDFSNPWVTEGIANPFPPFASYSNKPSSTYKFVGATAVGASFSEDFRLGMTQSWNFSVDQQLASDLALHLTYVGNEAYHLAIEEDMNPGGNGKTVGTLGVRPDSNLGQVIQVQPHGTSSYNSLQAGLDKHYSHNFQLGSNFTWAKTIDTTSTGNPSQSGTVIDNPFSLAWSRGISDLNVTMIWSSNFVYTTPKLIGQKSIVRSLLGEWQLSGIWTMQSGAPFGIQGGNGDNNSGAGEAANNYGDRGDWASGMTMSNVHQKSGSKATWLKSYFNTAAFTTNAIGTYGNTGKNILNGPGTASADAAIMKNWQYQGYHLQFRWEMFNAFNHASYANPSTDPSASSFGKITSTGAIAPRVMQGGLKLTF